MQCFRRDFLTVIVYHPESNSRVMMSRRSASTNLTGHDSDSTASDSEGGSMDQHTRDEELERYAMEVALGHSMRDLQLQEAELLHHALKESFFRGEVDLAEAQRRSGEEVDARQLESELLERALLSSITTPATGQFAPGTHCQPQSRAERLTAHATSVYRETQGHRPGSLDPRR